jgi:murein DD-endopeptidase MepM/ murein hydrolase activator NlpD
MALRDRLKPEQQQVLDAILAGARRNNASPKEVKAAIETGLVESNLQNLKGGDKDSAGWRQERASLYPDPTNLHASVDRFFRETGAVKAKYGTAGALAAAVQRPREDLRGKYQERSGEAQRLLDGLGGAGSSVPAGAPQGASDATQGPAPVAQSVAPVPVIAPQVTPSPVPDFGFSATRSLALPQGYVAPASTFAPPQIEQPDLTGTQETQIGSDAAAAQGSSEGGAPGATLVVGDSLGVGTAPYLKNILGDVTADAKVGRPSDVGVSVLSQALRGGRYSNVVLDLGTNDAGPQQLKRSIREAKKLAGRGVNIYIPTVNGPDAQAKNKVIEQEAGGNVHVVDWASKASGLAADGIHATTRGYQSRAKLIAQAIEGMRHQSLGARVGGGGVASPERSGKLGKIIGTPHSGTHTLGNWQSDNAVDIAMPTGTILQSLEDGVVEKVSGSYQGGASRFDGYQVTIRFKNGNRAFYTHLSKAGVKAGQRLRAGQAIGRSGAANGVQHLHLGVEKGDPRKLLRRAR